MPISFMLSKLFKASDQILNETNAKVFRFSDYQHGNSQNCITKETNDNIRQVAEFVKEPFAWLLGQSFKYLLDGTKHFDGLLNEAINELKINFNFPIVGYYSVCLIFFQ